MTWLKLSDDYVDHPKFVALSDRGFRLWHEAMCYCRKWESDGLLPSLTVQQFRYYSAARVTELLTPYSDGKQALWVLVEGFGYRVHDYLFWNPSKDEAVGKKREARERMRALREQRRVQPVRANTMRIEESVRANTSCSREQESCDIDRSLPDFDSSNTDRVRANTKAPIQNSQHVTAIGPVSVRTNIARTIDERSHDVLDLRERDLSLSALYVPEKGSGEKPMTPVRANSQLVDATIADRGGRLVERYQQLFEEHRKGARYRPRPALDWTEACDLCQTWDDDARLEKLAILVLTTDDSWIAKTDRSFKIFAMKASWADDRLVQWEKANSAPV